MLRVVLAAALIGMALQNAAAGEWDFNLSAEAGGEYASGLRYDHDLDFETAPLRTKDFRFTYEVSAAASYSTGPYRFRASYTFDQRTYEDYDLFHRRRHDGSVEVIRNVFWDIELGARYRYRMSQPEGPAGFIESDQLRLRGVLPWLPYEPWSLRLRPSAYMLWQTTDFHKLRFLDSDSWETGFGTIITPLTEAWTVDTAVAFGLIDARWNEASNSYIDVSMNLTSNTVRFFKESWTGPIAFELGLAYREEWYEGLGSDLGTQRHDRVSGIELTARRAITNRVGTYVRTSFDDHESNWRDENFDEVVAGVGLRVTY